MGSALVAGLKKHARQVRYLAVHKWAVLRAGIRLRVPLWRLVVHDWSKFLPCEWFPYADRFFAAPPSPRAMHDPGAGDAFDLAWLHHLHLNRHHWQWWVSITLKRDLAAFEMPETYAREMVADWVGAGMAQGKEPWEVGVWYQAHKASILLHPRTRILVERLVHEYASAMLGGW